MVMMVSWGLYSAGARKREERVIYDETPVGCGCAKYNCAMLVIYSRERSPECMVRSDEGAREDSKQGS